MYNEERKREFLGTVIYKADRNYIQKVFSASEPYENDEDIDLCDFDRESILHLFVDMGIAQFTTIEMYSSMTRKYQRWCMNNGYTKEREPIKLTTTEMRGCLVELAEIISYEELQRNENLLLNICDQLILESLYLGIKGNDYCELFSMSARDINVNSNTIKLCTGKVINVSNRFISLCRASESCYDYYLSDGRKQDLVGNYAIKTNAQSNSDNAKEFKNSKMIGSRLCRFKKIPGFKANLGTTMLYDSGFVNTCKAAMQKMEITDFAAFLKTEKGMEIYRQYDMPISNKSRKIYKYQGYFE